jgi:predicted solute-binding protein
VQILAHDTLATAEFCLPLRLGWIDPGADFTPLERLTAAQVGPEDFALLPAPEMTLLPDTHELVPDIAVVASSKSTVAMRTPVRPDEIDDAQVVLYDVSSTAEVLARALLWPFFGIETSAWLAQPSGQATVTIVEGVVALEDPEGGYSEDLARAWFVLTGLPLVTHVFAAPRVATDDDVDRAVSQMSLARSTGHERRRDLRRHFDETTAIPRERLVACMTEQRYALGERDREALVALLVRGTGGTSYHALTRLPIRVKNADDFSADET